MAGESGVSKLFSLWVGKVREVPRFLWVALAAVLVSSGRGKESQGVLDETASGRSSRWRLARHWKVPVPRPLPTGEIHDQVFLNGQAGCY